VIVIGAGMVGLSTAWYLQQSGVEVTVVDRKHSAAGSSSGNAGWLSPSLVLPLAEPALLKSGVAMMLSPASPLYIPPTLNPRLLRFLADFTRHCTPRRWHYAANVLAHASARMYEAYDEMVQAPHAPVDADVRPADPFLAVFATEAERQGLIHEFDQLAELGFPSEYRLLGPEETRSSEPIFNAAAQYGIALEGQRFINPVKFVIGINDAITASGGEIQSGRTVKDVSQTGSQAVVTFTDGTAISADAAVIATGSWLGPLARRLGVRKQVQAGRGYSFTVHPESPPANPFYLPAQRVACTPLGGPEDGLRVCGTMEFRPPDAPIDPRRIDMIVKAASTMMTGVDWGARTDEWVGPRPCTSDGLPLIGRTKSERIFVGGGHGMWGIALGPLTGKLLSQQILGDQSDALMLAFDPLRP
jgi:D-amino-acid dehydrogenase